MTPQPTLAELAAKFEPVDMPDVADLDTALRVINALCWQIERYRNALEDIEAHHIEQNARKFRDESRSTTLRLVRVALANKDSTQ